MVLRKTLVVPFLVPMEDLVPLQPAGTEQT